MRDREGPGEEAPKQGASETHSHAQWTAKIKIPNWLINGRDTNANLYTRHVPMCL